MVDPLTGLVDAFRAFGSSKELARAGGCSIETAKRYRLGRTTPDVLTLTRLMAASRAVADAVLRMAGLDDRAMDIEHARLLRSLAELHEQRAAAHVALEQAAASLRPVARAPGRVAGTASTAPHAPARREGETS